MLKATALLPSAIFKSRVSRILVLLFILWNLVDVYYIYKAVHAPQQQLPAAPPSKRIYIASLHYNDAALLRDYWNDAIVELSKTLGLNNVHVTAYESGSSDDTKGALLELDARLAELRVERSIVLSNRTHADEISEASVEDGWVKTYKGTTELRRIPYLARLRNLSLKPLEDLAKAGITFDYVLFLNDVVFQTDDVLRLLATNNGDYAAACALDFAKPPDFYDTFALFDTESDQYWTRTWPYFRSPQSRRALMRNEAVPVKSCWNGMAIFSAAPFYSAGSPLRFRAIPDSLAQSHVEASECCLIHADNPVSATKGVWLNPNVRVAYTKPAYEYMRKYHESLGPVTIFTRIWYSRIRRWFTTGFTKDWIVMPRFKKWEGVDEGRREVGGFCLLNEMHILTTDEWTHV